MSKQTDLAWNTNRVKAMQWLLNAFPCLFSSLPKPLKIGIMNDIIDAKMDGMPDGKWVNAAIGYYVRSTVYLRAMRAGVERFDLQGLPSGTVTPEAAALARDTLSLRKKKWTEAAARVKLAQTACKETIANSAIEITPTVNDMPKATTGAKRILTLKKKPLPELQD